MTVTVPGHIRWDRILPTPGELMRTSGVLSPGPGLELPDPDPTNPA